MGKTFKIQKQIRDNAKTLRFYMTDLQNWEAEMKRKEAALSGQAEQDLPPVRSKVKKEKPVHVPKKPEKRIASSDYQAWEKFDVDKACEDIDVKEAGPVSLDSKKSQPAKMDKFREEAQYEKEKGNEFVKQEKWDEAIKCYNRAIELINNDPIYYANRGLCYLKKESLHQAETDCTEALRLDPTYVKALQRRATARERLGSLRSASNDLNEVLKLEPNNNHAKRQLEAIKARMGTKGAKSKSSPVSTPTGESKPLITFKFNPTHKIQLSEEQKTVKELSPEEKWSNGVGENITVIKTVKKPPHLRSKRPLKTIPIHELQIGKTAPEKPPTRLKVTEVEDDMAKAETNNNDSKKSGKSQQQVKTYGDGDKNVNQSPESVKLVTEIVKTEKSAKEMTPPANSVQFMAAWKNFKGHDVARSDYLSIIEPSKIPSIFDNSLESDILSEILVILHSNIDKYKKISAYLRGLSGVKRFSALAMFLSSKDKELLNDLLKHCRSIEKCSEEEIADLKSRYEL